MMMSVDANDYLIVTNFNSINIFQKLNDGRKYSKL